MYRVLSSRLVEVYCYIIIRVTSKYLPIRLDLNEAERF